MAKNKGKPIRSGTQSTGAKANKRVAKKVTKAKGKAKGKKK